MMIWVEREPEGIYVGATLWGSDNPYLLTLFFKPAKLDFSLTLPLLGSPHSLWAHQRQIFDVEALMTGSSLASFNATAIEQLKALGLPMPKKPSDLTNLLEDLSLDRVLLFASACPSGATQPLFPVGQIRQIQVFDHRVRVQLFDLLDWVESGLKKRFALHHTKRHGEFAYLNQETFEPLSVQGEYKKILTTTKKVYTLLNPHHQVDAVPISTLTDHLLLSDLCHLIEYSDAETIADIARDYGLPQDLFLEALAIILPLRNRTAHGQPVVIKASRNALHEGRSRGVPNIMLWREIMALRILTLPSHLGIWTERLERSFPELFVNLPFPISQLGFPLDWLQQLMRRTPDLDRLDALLVPTRKPVPMVASMAEVSSNTRKVETSVVATPTISTPTPKPAPTPVSAPTPAPAPAKPKAQPQPQPKQKAKAQPQPQPEPKQKAKAQPQPHPKEKAKAQPQPQPKQKAKAQPQPQPQPKQKAKAEPKPQPQPKEKPKAEAKPKPQPKEKPKAEPKPQPKAKAQPKATQPSTVVPTPPKGKPKASPSVAPTPVKRTMPLRNEPTPPVHPEDEKPKKLNPSPPVNKAVPKALSLAAPKPLTPLKLGLSFHQPLYPPLLSARSLNGSRDLTWHLPTVGFHLQSSFLKARKTT